MNKPTLESFLSDVARHELTIEKDDGLFRYMKLSKPGSFNQHFHITTWPEYLAISGDMGCYVFSRCSDMFAFFRNGQADEVKINPGYWAEKVQAESVFGEGVKQWDADKARDAVQERFNQWVEDNADQEIADNGGIDEAREKVERLKNLADEQWEFITAVNDWDPDEACSFDLPDFWESRTESYTYHYIWCCYAIAWAIHQYDQHKASQDAAA